MKGRLMPSMPMVYSTFQEGIQGTLSTNCKPVDVLSKCKYSGTETARVASDPASASHRATRAPHKKIAAPASSGRKVITVRIGNVVTNRTPQARHPPGCPLP